MEVFRFLAHSWSIACYLGFRDAVLVAIRAAEFQFADASPKELQVFESVLKKADKRAKALAEERSRQNHKTRSR